MKNDELKTVQNQINLALRRLLSEQNRDLTAPAYGCFDRRYWAWKLVDFPEATFQRNVFPLAWTLEHPDSNVDSNKEDIQTAVRAGLLYTFLIQHRDGSFDQAFPNEHSYGATAFLLQPLLESFKIVKASMSNLEYSICENGLQKAAQFLCTKAETHGLISNHLAGAAYSLLLSGRYFNNKKFEECGSEIISGILQNQHIEGWFPEYGAADPGYQTLCIYYLAQAYQLTHELSLKKALSKALDFLAWFVHPDGSFGGEYGSRRTSIYYPGGIALLAKEFPLAAAMTNRMMTSISQNHTVTLQDIDIGNLAPLLQNMLLAVGSLSTNLMVDPDPLPCDQSKASIDFPAAGLSVRGTKTSYTVVGISNGGVVKVFEKPSGKIIFNDGGYIGVLQNGKMITSQMTLSERKTEINNDEISFEAPFFEILRSLQSPFQFLVLRFLNLTFMRSIWIGNLIKDILVKLLIQGKLDSPLSLQRTINFTDQSIDITDHLVLKSKLKFRSLTCGVPFTAIHMASARYYQGQSSEHMIHPTPIDIETLQHNSQIIKRIKI